MSHTFNPNVVLKTVSITVAFAFVMLSLGMPMWQFAQAASVIEFSDTLSDSAPSVGADHTIEFTTPSGMAAEGTITITLESFADVEGITSGDVEVDVDGSDATSDFNLTSSPEEIQLTAQGAFTIATGTDVVIRIGENTALGENQITNPTSPGSYPIQVDVDGVDSGETRVVILDAVEVTASVDTIFTFTIAGVAGGQAVNGDTTTGETTATTVPFGTLEAGQASTTAQDLSVETNAANGFAVTVQTDGLLQSSAGGVIQGFVEGSNTDTPTAWSSPTGDVGQTNTWSHWGLTTEDTDLTFGSSEYVAVTTTPVVVFENDGPANGTEPSVGTTRVGYTIEITALQPAGEDYTTTLTYIATPVF